MGSQSGFSVVEFANEKLIEVIPTSWLNKPQSKCSYPKKCTSSKLSKLRTCSGTLPNGKWPTFEVRVLGKYDQYTTAAEKANILQYESNAATLSESTNSQNTRKIRKRRSKQVYSPECPNIKKTSEVTLTKPKKIIFDSDSSSEESSQDQFDARNLTPVFETLQSPDNSKDSVLPEERNKELSNSHQENTPNVIPIRLNTPGNWNNPKSSLQSPDQSSGLDDQDEIDSLSGESESEGEVIETGKQIGRRYASEKQNIQSLDQFFREFRRFEATVLGELHSIKTDIEIIRADALRKGRVNSINCPISIPCTTENELKGAEEQLKVSNCREKLIQWCDTIGGHNCKSHTKRILCKLIDQDLSEKINFTGRGSKIQYKNLRLNAVVIAAVTSKQDCTADDVEKESMKFFRFARDRNGGRARRAKL